MIKLTALLLVTVAWLVPNHYPPWSSFYNEATAAFGLALLAVSIGARWLSGRIGYTAGGRAMSGWQTM